MSLTERVQAGERIDDLLIIDAHMHLNEPPFYVPATDAQACLTTMDKYGIALGISAPQLAITCDMRQGNDEILNIAAEEERLKAYCSISPHFPDEIADEMQRCRDAGAIGIKIHPSIHQVAITDARYDAVFDFAQEYGLPVLSHTWEGNPLCSPLKVSEIIERNPELKIIVGHSGGTFSGMRETIEVIKAYPDNLFADLTGSMQFLNRVEIMCEEIGAQRILYGSDAPWIEPGQTLGAVLCADISDEEKQLILGLNARSLFALKV